MFFRDDRSWPVFRVKKKTVIDGSWVILILNSLELLQFFLRFLQCTTLRRKLRGLSNDFSANASLLAVSYKPVRAIIVFKRILAGSVEGTLFSPVRIVEGEGEGWKVKIEVLVSAGAFRF